MGCAEFGPQLAIFRELSPAERERLQAHLATCPDCAATLAAYLEQDRLLSTLPVLRPSAKLAANILARTVGRQRRAGAPTWRWATAVLAIMLVFVMVMGGTINASAEALPGDLLYPVKRAAEEVRLTLTFDPEARDRYEEQLVVTRRDETQQVLLLGREADVEFQGPLEATADGGWSVGGVEVQIAPETWGATPPQPGTVVAVEGRAAGGLLSAQRVSVVPPKPVTPAAETSPTITAEPSRTAAKPSPTMSPEQGAAAPTPQPSATEEPKPLPSPSLTPGMQPARLTITPRIVSLTRVPTRTPGGAKPTLVPSATPRGSATFTPRPSRTRLPRPTRPPTRTPTRVEPYPSPTRTLRLPTPKPTLTPEATRPTPPPTRTPHIPWNTPKASPTAEDDLRTRQPSRTPMVSWPSPTVTRRQDQPWPTITPVPPTPTSHPTNTAVPPPATPRPTNTPIPPTATPVPPTATFIPPTPTPAPPTSTPKPTSICPPTPTCPGCGWACALS